MRLITVTLGLLVLFSHVFCATVNLAWNLPTHLSTTVNAGDTVVWITTDGLPHTVTSDTGTLLASPTIMAGSATDRFQFTFSQAGTFAYHCSIHGAAQMSGTVTVTSGGGGGGGGLNVTALPILPVLECVDVNGDGSFTAFFGYWSPNQNNISIPLGEQNNVIGGELPSEPETFLPGRQFRVFSATGNATGGNITWTVISGTEQNMAVATATSRNCSTFNVAPPGEVIPLLNCTVVNGNSYTAFMSYFNTGFEPLNITGGPRNYVLFVSPTQTATAVPVISTFLPGEAAAFNVSMPIDTVMTWTVINDYAGTSRSVRVTSNSPSCQPCASTLPA